MDGCCLKAVINFSITFTVDGYFHKSYLQTVAAANKSEVLLFHVAAYGVSFGREGPDQTYQDRADGHGADEGARERPRDAGGPAVQLGQVLHQHPRAPQNLAGQHGSYPPQERRSFRGLYP